MSNKLEKKLNKLLNDAYTELYTVAESKLEKYIGKKLSWEELKENAFETVIFDDLKRIVPFELFFVNSDVFQEIYSRYTNCFRNKVYRSRIGCALCLGPSPSSSKENYNKYWNIVDQFYEKQYALCNKQKLNNFDYVAEQVCKATGMRIQPPIYMIMYIEIYKQKHNINLN